MATSEVRKQRSIQKKVDADDSGKSTSKPKPMQAGARKYPVPPFPKQHHRKPGMEHEIDPAPMYDAPFYKGSDKLQGKVALITGGDSGIGRAVAVLFAREGADIAVAYLSEHKDAGATKAAVEAEGRRAIVIAGDVSERKFCDKAVAKTLKEFGRLDILVNNAAFTRALSGNLIGKGIRVNCVAPGPVWTPLNPSEKEAEDVSKFGSKTPMKRPAQPEEIAPAYVFLASPQMSSYITGEILPIVGGY